MKCICKLFALDKPAKDGSVIPTEVCRRYIESNECKEDLEKRKMLGSLTHRSRNLQNIGNDLKSNSISKTIGADDMNLIPESGCSCPTHYIESMWIEDGWLMGVIHLLDEEGMDDIGKNYIRRVKGLLRQGVKLPGSLVIIAFWQPQPGTNQDTAQEIKRIKGYDWTLCESSIGAGVDEIFDDEGERMFSSTSTIFDGNVRVKTFSSPYEAGIDINTPKTSKINGKFTTLKAKEFSINGSAYMSEDDTTAEEKKFSVMAVKDRIREAKMNPRMRFRKMVMNYKQAIRSLGGVEKIDPETLKIMKSLFTTDILDLMKTITPEVLKGKPINTLLGASSLGKNVRVAVQKLQMPYRMALQESQKAGFVSKMRYEKIQSAYIEFCRALEDEVFSSNSTIPDIKDEGEEEVQENEK